MLRDVPDAERMRSFIEEEKPRRALVIGAGFIGIESAEALVRRGLKVIVVELMPRVLPNMDADIAIYIEKELRAVGVDLILKRSVKDFIMEDNVIKEVLLDGGERVECDLVFASVGVKPGIELSKILAR